jgi:hypothetical protein
MTYTPDFTPLKWTAGDIRGWRVRGAINNNISMEKDPLCEEQAGEPPSGRYYLVGETRP